MARKNILFIMCGQLRCDYLGCTGHPSIRTRNIGALAARGVTFANLLLISSLPLHGCPLMQGAMFRHTGQALTTSLCGMERKISDTT